MSNRVEDRDTKSQGPILVRKKLKKCKLQDEKTTVDSSHADFVEPFPFSQGKTVNRQ